MSSVYTPTAVGLTTITIPSDGDVRSAASVNTPLKSLADAVKARLPPTTLSLSADRVRLLVPNGSGTPSPALNAIGTFIVPSTEIDNNDTQFGIIRWTSAIAMASTGTLYLPLDEALSYNGYTISSCVVKAMGKAGHAGLPAGMPAMALVRFGSSANTSLHSTVWHLDTSANAAAYEVEHNISISPDQNAVIDCSQYQYALLLQNESGANALDSLEYRRIVLTLTAP